MIETSGMKFWHVSIGNVVSWIIIAIGFVSWGQKLTDKVDHIGGTVNRQGLALEEMSKLGVINTMSQHERRISDLERMSAGVAEMSVDIKWIKAAMKQSGGHIEQ